ncbi:hypothetical protein PtA15_8A303 [Puccinia triticina]|uniref:Uncharacterized protein n=1 Tax=Puccinia triticina TaxID=208348 RepID=A0ABY7CRW4_9BASI|nr:uncharacterized protein PtA15_8A303 [Puccinia triticina]WAQ87399.1 hypothetical protein PtA15_8A303 [Puccinia triticina]
MSPSGANVAPALLVRRLSAPTLPRCVANEMREASRHGGRRHRHAAASRLPAQFL